MIFLKRILSPKEIRVSLIAAVGVLLVMFLGIIISAHGNFIYIQDDAYIHLSIAKNFADSATWGINPGEFASASSSPLWIAILTLGFLIFGGLTTYLPLLINIFSVIAVVIIATWLLYAYGIKDKKLFFLLGAVSLVTPLAPFAFSGMEHASHILAVVVFLYSVGLYLSPKSYWPQDLIRFDKYLFRVIGLSSFFVAGLRYEGIFVVAIASVLLLLRKQYRAFLVASISGALPVLTFGFWSLLQGENFVPNTLLIKKKFSASLLQNLQYTFENAYQNIKMPIFQIFAPLTSFATWYSSKKAETFWRPEIVALALVTVSFIAQAVMGRFSWVAMFRYEAYLILAGLLFLILAFSQVPIRQTFFGKSLFTWSNLFLIGFLLVISLPFVRRVISWPYVFLNAKNIYEQTVFVSRFLNTTYAGEVVGANDIGLVAYPGKVTLVDFWGLADKNVMNLRINGKYNKDTMTEYARKRGVKVLAVFSSWFGNTIDEKDWFKVGSWTIPYNVTAGDATVTFYAPDCGEVIRLQAGLRDFQENLPYGVVLVIESVDQGVCGAKLKVTK